MFSLYAPEHSLGGKELKDRFLGDAGMQLECLTCT